MIVTVHSTDANEAVLDFGLGTRRAAVGIGGIGAKRAEGDGITPIGTFAVRRVLYRADRIECPRTRLPLNTIARDDGWCDAPRDPNYNLPVKLPYGASAESLWREDHLYDLIVVLGFNDAPVVAGAGSAIFLHVAQPSYSPTQGCIALAVNDLLELLVPLEPSDLISITA